MSFLRSVFAVAVFAFFLPACGKLPPIQWPKLANCGADAGMDLVDDVTQVFAEGGIDKHNIGDKALDILKKLAADHSADVVSCAVQRVVDMWQEPGAAREPRRSAALDRALDFQSKAGTAGQFTSSGGER